MNHFYKRLTSPKNTMCVAYGYMIVIFTTLYFLDFYNSGFLSWGPPINFMGKTIEDQMTYYAILLFYFNHQIINNWVNAVVYPWIINCVQDPKSHDLIYSEKVSIILINGFALYSQLDVMLIIAGIMSQISFFIAMCAANLIAVTAVNWKYISQRQLNLI